MHTFPEGQGEGQRETGEREERHDLVVLELCGRSLAQRLLLIREVQRIWTTRHPESPEGTPREWRDLAHVESRKRRSFPPGGEAAHAFSLGEWAAPQDVRRYLDELPALEQGLRNVIAQVPEARPTLSRYLRDFLEDEEPG